MRIERIRLENFKCYADADLRLETGVTVIHGLNGSGKSSLLEAAFFALYGSKALSRTLEEVVTIGAEETVVELWFAHDGGDYHVRRRLRTREEGAKTVECVLEGPEATVEGARDVRARVAELLRMDNEAFVNCAYVRQGEVNKLINASPGQRQDMLDDLLQLGKLEDYRERASDARVGVGRVRDDTRGALSQLDEQIEAKEDKDLPARLNETESELAEVAADIERFEGNREEAQATLEDAESVLETYRERREELEELEADITELRETIGATATEREELAEEVAGRREDREAAVGSLEDRLAETDLEASGPEDLADVALAERIEDLEAQREAHTERVRELSVEMQERESEAESGRETAAELEERASDRRETADELAAETDAARETLADRREQLADLNDEIEAVEATFEDAPVGPSEAEAWREDVAEELADLRETIAEREATLESERAALAEAKELLAAGKCPECGQDVAGAPHVETIDEDEARVADLEGGLEELRDTRETLEERLDRADRVLEAAQRRRELRTRRDNLEQLLEETEAGLAEKEQRVGNLREEAEELDAEAEEARDAVAAAEAAAAERREEIGAENAEKADLEERIERLEAVAESRERIEELDGEIDRLRERRAAKAETNEERRERLAEKRERRDDLADDIDEDGIEEARAERERAADYLERVEDKLADLRERRDDLQAARGGLENEIEELEALRDRRAGLSATVEDLESLYEEAADLEAMYGTLRAELRQRNVETLERMLNETFDLVYGNDSYSHIELDGEYRLTVFQKDGEALAPDQLSGGERALFNLSLRSSIYRLLAEGIEGAAPMPPLILDEPTVFLDAGHVSQLVDLVDHMRDLGVEQILVVSHDESLLGAADDLVTVRTDPTTNRATVERADSPDAAALAGAESD